MKKAFRDHIYQGHPANWDRYLALVLFALRTRQNAATGYTPSELLLGYNLPRPGELPPAPRDSAERLRQVHQRRDRALANQHRYRLTRFPGDKPVPAHYDIGEEVLVRASPVAGQPFAAR